MSSDWDLNIFIFSAAAILAKKAQKMSDRAPFKFHLIRTRRKINSITEKCFCHKEFVK